MDPTLSPMTFTVLIPQKDCNLTTANWIDPYVLYIKIYI